jgi:hypothetical protein
MSSDSSGWLCYSPFDPSSHGALTPELRETAAAGRPSAEIVAEVHLYLATLDQGQTEIRFTGPADVPKADVLHAAIRELKSAIEIFSD